MESYFIFALALIAVCCFLRPGATIVVIIVWDAVRDPIRKLLDVPPLPVAAAGSLLWVAAFSALCWRQCAPSFDNQAQTSRYCNFALACLMLFLSLGCVKGIASGTPLMIIALGVVSYIFPVIGGVVAIREDRSVSEVHRLLLFYVAINVVFVLSAFIEISGYESQIVGGIQMEWYRVRSGVHIPLPSGLYRSPDILGFHVAHVALFSGILAWTTPYKRRKMAFGFVTAAMLIVSIFVARRKMQGLIAISILAASTLCLIQHRRNLKRFRTVVPALVVVTSIIGLFCWYLLGQVPQVQYAASTLMELPSRVATSIYYSPLETVRQNGFFGRGLGIATQGGYHFSDEISGIWQEDGVGRLVIEGGLLGCIALIAGMGTILIHLLPQIGRPGPVLHQREVGQKCLTQGLAPSVDSTATSLFLYSIVVGNCATLLISHQHLSGDPIGLGMIGYLAGTTQSLQTKRNV